MRQKICKACFNFTYIPLKKLKYIDFKDDFVCSTNCILKWLRKYSNNFNFKSIAGVSELIPDQFSPRSLYENNVALFLSDNSIKWKYERYGFIINEIHNASTSSCCTYTPDFYLPEYNCFLEVKGCWGIGQKEKMRLFRKQYPNIKLLVISWLLSNQFNTYALGVIR